MSILSSVGLNEVRNPVMDWDCQGYLEPGWRRGAFAHLPMFFTRLLSADLSLSLLLLLLAPPHPP